MVAGLVAQLGSIYFALSTTRVVFRRNSTLMGPSKRHSHDSLSMPSVHEYGSESGSFPWSTQIVHPYKLHFAITVTRASYSFYWTCIEFRLLLVVDPD
jgi:hypothetical protein